MDKFDYNEFTDCPCPSLEEITSSWKEGADTPLVSILCNTYNHKEFIEDALRGFLIQKTEFPFEIIIHDDASSDGTSGIIQEYANRYPALIKPVLQTVNQYSQGKKPTPIAVQYASGQYVALCEGDDFWIEENKLQMQVDCMLENQDIDLCFHSAYKVTPEGDVVAVIARGVKDRLIDLNEVIEGGGGFMPTASIVVKRDVIVKLPDWFADAPVGDYFIQVYGSLKGACYLNRTFSAYRWMINDSWSDQVYSNHEKFFRMVREMLRSVQLLESDNIFKNVHARSFTRIRSRLIYDILLVSYENGFFIKGMREALRLGLLAKLPYISGYFIVSIRRALSRRLGGS